MQVQEEIYDYEPFAETEEYKKVNGDIIKRWVQILIDTGTTSIDRLLDIATGAGTMVNLFFGSLPLNLRETAVLCLDQSSGALNIAKSKLEKQIDKIKLINSPIQQMDIPEGTIDIALWGNGIHYLDEQEHIDSLIKIRKVLKPGGYFFFNTAFYEEARPAETIPFYRTQVKNAVQFLKKNGITRVKNDTKTEAAKFHPKAYYEELVEKSGFRLVEAQEFAANLTKEAWEHISSFQQYAAGALRGYPTDVASTAMKNAVGPSIEIHGKIDSNGRYYVVRNWLAISAQA